jgi:hypothetical protein
VVSIPDLGPSESLAAFRNLRRSRHGKVEEDSVLHQTLAVSGGRLAFMARLARSKDLVREVEEIKSTEKGWLLSQLGLIPDCDDDIVK